MARPKKILNELKILQINIRVTLDEQVYLEEVSKNYGMTVVEFIRVKSLKKSLPKNPMSTIKRESLVELSRIGNNINQLTKKVNQHNPNLAGFESELLNLKDLLNELKKELLR